MKHEAVRHPKMQDLAEKLSVPLYAAIGIMETLWHYAGDFAPRGDLGRASDAAIARAIDWRKPPSALIDALVACGWLDRSEKYRLVIHDWPDHAQDWVRKKVGRSRDGFLPEYARGLDIVQSASVLCPDLVLPLARGVGVKGSGIGNSPGERARENPAETQLLSRYHEFVELWPAHNRRGVDFGAQVWIAFVDSGKITETNIHEIFEGLERHKTCEQWNRDGGKYIPAIADETKPGWLQKRAWKDMPKQAEVDSWAS